MCSLSMYRIGDFSQIAQVSIRMLRHYDKLGLLKPEQVDIWTGYRYYTLDQLPRIHRILALKDLGLSLDEIGDLIDNPKADKRLYEILQVKRQSIEQQLDKEQTRLKRVATRLREIEKIHEPILFDVALKSLAAQQIIAIREIVPHISQMGIVRKRVLEDLYSDLSREKIEPGLELAIYHDRAYTEDNIDMSMAVEIEREPSQLSAECKGKLHKLAQAPLAASIVFNGVLTQIPDVVSNLYRWMGMNGFASAGEYREIHLFGRELQLCSTDPPGEGVIEILVPVKKIGK